MYSFGGRGLSQSHIQKSLLELKQDQEYSYGVMGNVFSALECYANKSSPNKQPFNYFGYYNNFNSGNTKNLEQLKDQIITQLEIFKYSYQMYKKEHNEYHFPNNMKKDQIIILIEKMKEYVKPEDRKYYDAIVQIIDSKNVSYINETINRAISKGADPYHANQGFIIGDGGYATTISQKYGEEIQRKYHNNPNYEPQLYLNQSSPYSLPKTSNQRVMDSLIEELIKNCNELEIYKTYNNNYTSSLKNKIKNNFVQIQELLNQNPNYYYSNKDLSKDINKMNQAINSFNCSPDNKEIFNKFLSILLEINPKNNFM